MAETQIAFNVPREIIDAHIKAAVAHTLGKDPEALVRAVVEAAMAEKPLNGYSTDPPIWQSRVNAMIREVAEAAFKEWLEEQRPLIARMIRERLGIGAKAKMDKIVSLLLDALTKFQINIYLPRD